MENPQLTREDTPEIETDDVITVETKNQSFIATVLNLQDNGASNSYTLSIDGDTAQMYSDVRCVELIYNNKSYFVEDIHVE
jgi:hypothetical protein